MPAPHTWREILATLDERLPVANLVVAIQEYGAPNISLIAGLEARGASVESVPVYRWDVPENLAPLQENIRRLVDGQIDIALFTSAQQIVHVIRIAKQMRLDLIARRAGQSGRSLDRPDDERDAAGKFFPGRF